MILGAKRNRGAIACSIGLEGALGVALCALTGFVNFFTIRKIRLVYAVVKTTRTILLENFPLQTFNAILTSVREGKTIEFAILYGAFVFLQGEVSRFHTGIVT